MKASVIGSTINNKILNYEIETMSELSVKLRETDRSITRFSIMRLKLELCQRGHRRDHDDQ